ncbi:MAG: leucine-rich repeat domain-containing protein [bacterium]|nr:leucine-rich repeat domain-containing protein [bacterium]
MKAKWIAFVMAASLAVMASLPAMAEEGFPLDETFATEETAQEVLETEPVESIVENMDEEVEEPAEEYSDYVSNGWKYTISDGVVTVTGYTGSSTSITIPSTLGGYPVKKIGNNAFENSSIRSVVIPEGIISIGTAAFKNCSALNSVTINARELQDVTGDAHSPYSYAENYAPFFNAGASSGGFKVTFGSSVKYIPANLFATGRSKTDGTYAHVTSVVMSSGITEIHEYAFDNCHDLKNITWGSEVSSIGDHAFYNCTGLTQLTLPSKVKRIEGFAFEGCSGVKTLTIPEGTAYLGRCAFKSTTGLTNIIYNAKQIDDVTWEAHSSSYDKSYAPFFNAGSSRAGLTVKFGSSVQRIPANLFATVRSRGDDTYCHISSVEIPTSVTTIGEYAFYNCHDLKSVKYTGSMADWSAVRIGEYNDSLTTLNVNCIAKVTEMYRLYNPNTGEHFYTGSIDERTNLVNVGWNYEGIGWYAPVSGGKPVYRLFNPNTGDHHYTMSWDEVEFLKSVGWRYEGICWNSAEESDSNVAQFRLYNPNAIVGIHHYTSSVEERDYLVSLGWRYEGIGWYGVPH